MMISTKGRYALRFLVDIAEHQAEGYVPLKDVAERQGISEKYLESIVKTLVRADVLTGLRGKGGGYRLRKSRPRRPELRPHDQLPDPPPLAGPGAGDPGVPGQIHHRRPHGPRRQRRVRLCDLSWAAEYHTI